MTFYFHQHEFDLATKAGDTIGASRAKLAIESIVRTSINMTQVAYTGAPLDFDSLAYWCHRLVAETALMHIKFGERNEEWQTGLDTMKFYLRGIEPRYKLYGECYPQRFFCSNSSLHSTANYLREVELAEEATKGQ